MSAPLRSHPLRLSPVEETLADIWRHALSVEAVGPHDDFFQLGGDSLSAAHAIVQIQKVFGREFPVSTMHQAPTIRDFAALLSRQSGIRPSSCLVALQPRGTAPPFFCVHGAGGTTLGFQDLARHFAPHRPFYGTRAPSWQRLPPGGERVEDMAARYVKALRERQGEGPYYLGGYSFGGSIALELAQQLRAQGETVALLAILDHTPPPLRYRRFVWSPTLPLDFVVNAAGWVGVDIWGSGRGQRLGVLKRKARAAVAQCRNWLRFARPASGKDDVTEIFAGRMIPPEFRAALEAHYEAMRGYVPQPYPGRVALFRARIRPLFRLHGRDLGWKQLAGNYLETVTVPGNHETMIKAPHAKVLAHALLNQLDKAQRRLRSPWRTTG
jgi:thioesterase domain-containing protein/acyl carrier protein